VQVNYSLYPRNKQWKRARKPRDPKLGPSEHKIQTALFDYLALAARPELEIRAIPNGEKRHIAVASRLKAEGVKRGTPDIFICLPAGKVAWLEMKAEKGRLSPDQILFRDRVLALGHLWGMASSVDEALEHLTAWDALKPAYRHIKANDVEAIRETAEAAE
jgi:hypothetical protein